MSEEFKHMDEREPIFGDPKVVMASNAPLPVQNIDLQSEPATNTQSAHPSNDQTFTLPARDNTRPSTGGVSLHPVPDYLTHSDNRTLLTSQAELDKRAKELDEKERQLAERERLQKETMGDYHPPNFPPFPKGFCVKPCFYISIKNEIPEHNQSLCQRVYYQWIAYCAILAFDLICAISIVASAGSSEASTIVFAILLCPAFVVLSFLFCFRPIYLALKTSSSFNFYLFFGCYGLQIGVNFIQCLGIKGSGWAGFINGAHMLEGNKHFAGYVSIICGFFFVSLAIYGIVMLRFIWKVYKGSGASLQQAQSEFTSGAWKLGGSAMMSTMSSRGGP